MASRRQFFHSAGMALTAAQAARVMGIAFGLGMSGSFDERLRSLERCLVHIAPCAMFDSGIDSQVLM